MHLGLFDNYDRAWHSRWEDSLTEIDVRGQDFIDLMKR